MSVCSQLDNKVVLKANAPTIVDQVSKMTTNIPVDKRGVYSYEDFNKVSLGDIQNQKDLSDADLHKELQKILKFKGDKNTNSFVGNKVLYHYQFRNLLKCRRQGKDLIHEIMENDEKRHKLICNALKLGRAGNPANRMFEAYRMRGSIVMFKASAAKFLYKKYKATSVLDPTSGWGGRMLGAWGVCKYTGIDTNTNMKPVYDDMILKTDPVNLRMIWDDCLKVDFSTIGYDFVLTSPPYSNMEIYEEMTPWATDEIFYKEFLIPLIDKCRKYCKKGGKVCFNISPKMYEDILALGYEPAHIDEDLLQQLGQQHNTSKKQDKIYIWNV